MKKYFAKIMAVLSPIPVASFSAYAENELLSASYDAGPLSVSKACAVLAEGNVVLPGGIEISPETALIQEDSHVAEVTA